MKVQHGGRFEKVEVTADGKGLASHAGSGLLVAVADKVGLTDAFSEELAQTRERRSAHDPGEVVRDLCVMLTDGGDCLSDLGALRDQESLFGRVASNATAFRVIDSLCEEGMLDCLRAARARARWRAWELGARPERIVLDLDATLITSHSDKQQAAGNYKGGFGFHPMLCYLDGSEEGLAGVLRPGNAGSNTAQDQIDCVDLALEQLPPDVREEAELLLRTDSAGLVHDLLDHLSEQDVRFSVGMDMTEDVRQAVLQIADEDWVPAISVDGAERERAFVAELLLDLSGWPEGSRAICRRERAHPGAQLSLIDQDGWRHQVFMTDQQGGDIAQLDLTHRGHARVEDRIRCGKDTGLQNLPFRDFQLNAVWLELSMIAQDLIAWTKALSLDGELRSAEPKRLRYRLLHQAGRIARSARKTRLRLERSWPWAAALVEAFARIRALPSAPAP
ncbi:MAG: IS1380 family transposase [Actinobacteria bacterium]|nr:IS1380 family transposase [Actinomycetota bacterium]MCA1698431.1 IS1380 family transposase [Actinomycetota bacterium]